MNSSNSEKPGSGKPVVVKKYANRRLYNTATSSYVTLDDLAKLIKEGGDFVVHDAKTGEDITRSVLTQIIVEQEQKGQNLLPISFLRQLIGFYGDSMQWLVPGYLEQAMAPFAATRSRCAKACRRRSASSRSGSSRRWASRTWRCSNARSACWLPTAAKRKPRQPMRRRRRPGRGRSAVKRLEAQIDALTRQLEVLGRDRGDDQAPHKQE